MMTGEGRTPTTVTTCAPEPSRLERAVDRLFGDAEPTGVGSGWISGTAGVFLGALAVLGVLAFHFPGIFTTAEFRAHYPVPLLRALLQTVIGISFLLSATSLLLRQRKVLGLTGLALSLAATLGGGSAVPVQSDFAQPFTIGLDWFALNLLLLTVVFVPLERVFPRRPEQGTFRFGWLTDGVHFMVSHLAIQALAFLTLLPATGLAAVWQPEPLQARIAGLPLWGQFLAIVFLADLAQYWTHRMFHAVPALWRIHAVHHSSQAMDWLAGSRIHVIDILTTRAIALTPIVLLGFARPALYAYLLFVSFHAVFIHANVRFRFGWLDYVVATPRGHHWHHAVTPIDKNFAVHLPVLDRVFGTQHLPGEQWPDEYGVHGHPVPEGWARQLAFPFTRPDRQGDDG
jgi:sterol desaturase/sphingolipid hydroxylase (fatty acid hydroxylase superfamily)